MTKPTTTKPPVPPAALSVNDCAAYLGLHPSTVYRAIRRGDLPARKFGGTWRVSIRTLDAWLDSHGGAS